MNIISLHPLVTFQQSNITGT